MPLLRFLAAIVAALAFAAAPVGATPQRHDGNDLWMVPDESGWGINIFHQGDTLFAALFVYGPDGKARWYSASNLAGNGLYAGALYESSGPAIGTAFHPSRVTRRQVGTMSIELGTESGGGAIRDYANVAYDVDGVRVIKRAYRFGFAAMGLTGSYIGYMASASGVIDTTFNVVLDNGSFAMTTTSAAGASCTYSGPQQPDGSLFSVAGTYSCNDGRSGGFTLADVDVTRHGFTATGSLGDIAAQRRSSAIRGDGYNTDLWFDPAESGWGLTVVEQGDIVFGALYVYDAEGKPHWYSASSLAYEQCAPPDSASDCNARYRGALYESTGPYFGTSFNAAAVQRRQVGTMSIDRFGDNTAYLDYTIDGISVTRKQLSRFAFRTNALAGAYAGHMTAQGNNDRGVQLGAMTIEVAESGESIVIAMRGSRGTCTMRGSRSQYGRQVSAAGAYDCGAGLLGQMQLLDVYVTSSGFTGRFGLDGFPIGRIEAVRTTAQ